MKRDEEFWLDDGTVILIARDVEFRVYGGVLATHSPVFKELLSEDSPVRTVSINGKDDVPCPVVALSDSPEDLRHILRVYMPRSEVSMFPAREPSFAFISASIRLGKKYKMTPLYEQSIAFLKRYYPSELDKWTELHAWAPDGWPTNRAIGVINLARLSGELSLLPGDGSQETLAPEDLDICFKAKTELRKASIKLLFDILSPFAAPECTAPSTCSEVFRSALAGLYARLDDLLDSDPFFPYTTYVKIEDGKFGVCEACLAMTEERCWNGRQKLWDRLPEVLRVDVPGWGEAESTD
ncbi:hypothetical protein C8T65DRAFT_749389 [Cerioporus squamosus]|nr:hypothetical protein C8T65DRAFT_749389 [Cerioporus squamosus]